jgi:hypothetical protein
MSGDDDVALRGAPQDPTGGAALRGARDGGISASVNAVVKSNERITAAEITAQLLLSHPHYVRGARQQAVAQALRSPPASLGRISSAQDWLRQTRNLFQMDDLFDGRKFILGLALLEPALMGVLRRSGALTELLDRTLGGLVAKLAFPSPELIEIEPILSAAGVERLRLIEFGLDAVPTGSDAPATEDLLFREPFAEALAMRIRAMRAADEQPRPLMVLLDGPWGSGKSTVLGFVARMLSSVGPTTRSPPAAADGRWIIVRYNAWQYQRMDPPWWTLANVLVTQLTSALGGSGETRFASWRLSLRHLVFRTLTGRTITLAVALGVIGLGVVLVRVPGFTPTGAQTWMSFLKDLLAVLAVVFGLLVGAVRFLTATDQASQDFLASRPDPMGALEEHLRECLKSSPRPVCIMIDDVDRCEAQAVVKLLEGVQVLFGAAPITFLFAGDRRWVGKSFEKVYEDFNEAVSTPARALGSFFVEKTFQLSVWLPEATLEARERYWRTLIGLKPAVSSSHRVDLSSANTEAGLLRMSAIVEASDDLTEKLAFRQEAVRRLAAPEVARDIEAHTLGPMAALAEPNPRGMKRLVMAYGMTRTVDLLSGRQTAPHTLALWTILCLRWPELGAWLRRDPDRLAMKPEDFSEESHDRRLAELLATQEAQSVVRGLHGEDQALTLEVLRAIVA